jgi:hypothetical protein
MAVSRIGPSVTISPEYGNWNFSLTLLIKKSSLRVNTLDFNILQDSREGRRDDSTAFLMRKPPAIFRTLGED